MTKPTKEAREAAEAWRNGALPVQLEDAFQSLITNTIERCAAVADEIGESYGMDEAGWTDCTETVATAIRQLGGE